MRQIWRRVIVSSTNLRTVLQTSPAHDWSDARAAVRLLGTALRMPKAPAASSSEPIVQAWPMHIVASRMMHGIVSYMAQRHAAAAMRLMQCVPVVGFGVWRGSGLAARTLSRRPSGRRRCIIQGGRQVLQHAQRVDRGQHI